jgi:hypothetical protein
MMMRTFRESVWIASSTCSLLLAVGCGDRPAAWDSEFELGSQKTNGSSATEPQIKGLTGSLAVLDGRLNEVMMLTSPAPFELTSTRLPVGRDVVKFEKSIAEDKLFVLSRGVVQRFKDTDEKPQLRIFDGDVHPSELEHHTLQDPYDQLEIDPLGEWLIVHGSEGLVSNPNELILVKLGENAEQLPSKTLDSYGGKPGKFQFTSALTVPGAAARRLLVVLREKDLAIIDLMDLNAPEITVGLPEKVGGGYVSPAAVAYHDGIPGEVGPMLAVQLQGDNSVYLLTLHESTSAEHAFSLEANLVDVGGEPSTIDFVQTERDGGLRLAALVPSRSSAMLVDPASSNVQEVKLPRPFTRIQRITDEVKQNSGEDIALLYGQTNTIAFWQLGTTTGTPYRSIDAYDIGITVSDVTSIPGPDFPDRKVLKGTSAGQTQQFYVLDLTERKSFPLDALRNLTLNIAPDGQRLWAYDPFTTGFAQLTFEPLQPSSLYTQEPIVFVHDMKTGRGGTQRSAVALHVLPEGHGKSLAATLFDGVDPDTSDTRFVGSIELMGIK